METDAAPPPRLVPLPPRGPWQQAVRLGAAAVVGVLLWLLTGAMLPRGCAEDSCSWFVTGDPLVALGCLTAVAWRRRFPVPVALAVAVASAASALASGAALLAIGSLAARRRPAEIAPVVAAFVIAPLFTTGLYPVGRPPGSPWIQLSLQLLTAGFAVATGWAVGARRAEVLSLRERARSAEREQTALADRARVLERNRIAREMHDSLAHRISLVALQAGALDHRPDLPDEERAVLVRGIADGSYRALEDLRDVLGVLRAEQPDRPEPPRPSYDRVPALVDDARASGMDVTLTVGATGEPPDALGDVCYRVVREALTNAAKHAPGAPVRITLDGAPGGALGVAVRNDPAARTRTGPPPASGYGLPGLAERVRAVGGTLDHHPAPDGGFTLTARLPWPADEAGRTAGTDEPGPRPSTDEPARPSRPGDEPERRS
ncbi:sensor histidine kinase [Streptomyces rubiginosohelvolus]|uniref:sensor histidine kinase n=1 Tax=Streptomyces rubiginosohelvolus TaxID=67362 RepID=UPI003F8DA99E